MYEGSLAGRCVRPQRSPRFKADGLYQGANNIERERGVIKTAGLCFMGLEEGEHRSSWEPEFSEWYRSTAGKAHIPSKQKDVPTTEDVQIVL